MTLALVILAFAFAWSIGSHYTGACMGMPVALRAIRPRHALLLMAPLAFIGAAFASHRVELTVGHELVRGRVPVAGELVVLAVALALTAAFNRFRIPTSTIQILVSTIVGAALAFGARVNWSAIGALVILWGLAPPVAAALGFALTQAAGRLRLRMDRLLGIALVTVGSIASFAMGANDVANATGPLVASNSFSPLTAGLIGGSALAAGVVVGGQPLLQRVAFDIVRVDRAMATAAQLVQGLVVLVAVAFGYFTSMNQALVGAMAGAGLARGRDTIDPRVFTGILTGWLLGPAAGLMLGYATARLISALTSTR